MSQNKLQLPSVALICVDCINPERAVKVLDHCKSMCDFGAVKLLTNSQLEYEHKIEIPALNSLVAYSIFMLTKAHDYIETDHLLIVQRDGWILNPQSFDPEWLELDYIAPLFMQYDRCGSGGFSLRSKKIMHGIAKNLSWDYSEEQANSLQSILGYYEDGILSLSEFSKNYKIASLEQAANFSQGGNRNPEYFREYPFGFHRTWQEIDFKTGRVDSSDLTRDISNTYDHIIDEL